MRTQGSSLGPVPAAAVLLHAAAAMAAPVSPPPDPVAETEDAPFERRFLAGRLEQAELTGRICQLCEARAGREALRSYCGKLAEAQRREAAQTRTLLGERVRASGLSPEGQARLERLAALPAEQLDVGVLRELLDIQVAGAQRSALCISRAPRTLASHCTSVLEARAEAAGRLRSWLCDWHGVCPTAAAPVVVPHERPWAQVARRD